MRTTALRSDFRDPKRELILLLVASAAIAGLFAVGLSARSAESGLGIAGAGLQILPVIGLSALGLLLGILFWRSAQPVALPVSPLIEAQQARRTLAVAEALVRAEPQVLLLWEDQQPLRLLAHSLTDVPGVPSDEAQLLRFGRWLEPRSAEAFKAHLDDLFQAGASFHVIIKTLAGGHLEADGRASAGRAILRLRDIAGYRRDLIGILERHQRLARDIRSSRALLNALPVPVWVRDASGRLGWVNTAYVKAVDAATDAEVVDRQLELLDSRQRQSVDRTIARGQGYRRRVQLTVCGERKSHEVVVLPLEEVTAGAAIDLGAADPSRIDHDRSAHSYDRTLDRVATAVAIFSRDQRLTFFNEAYLKLWQLDANWLETNPTDGTVLDRLRELGRLPEVVNYREWKAQILSCYTTALEPETRWHLPDGRVLHVIAELRPDGGVTYLYVDESKRLALESQLNALVDVQRETLNSLKEGVAVFATDGRLKLHNASFAAIWRLPAAALTAVVHIDEVIRFCRESFADPRVWADIGRAVTAFSDQRGAIEGQMVRSDLSVIDYAVTPLPDGATLLTFVDVSAAKREERALLERNEALEAADRLKSQFISHVSYELRTPLTNIIGFSELMANPAIGPLNEKQQDYLGDITSSSQTLLSIVDDILDLATIDAGGLDLKLQPVDVRTVIQSAIEGVRDRAARNRLTIDIGLAENVSVFTADEARVRQVLYNLLSNAVGFSPPGNDVHLTCWRQDGHMVFAVEDQGIGIPLDQQARVFERFESRSQGSRHRGAGLGLSIVKSLVDLHGGDMKLESDPGRGTRVTVRFPENGVAQQAIPAPARRPRASRSRQSKGTGARS